MEKAQAKNVTSYDMWYSRLGHPSCEPLAYISKDIKRRDKNDLCDVCLCANRLVCHSLLAKLKH